MSQKLVLIDGHSILNRAFYGVPDLSNAEGLHTNAVYGFLNIMFKILEEEKPEYLAVAFDVHAPTFRHQMYKAYKGTRKPMPEELREQVPVMKEVLKAMHITIMEQAGLEADDILGTLAKKAEQAGMEVSSEDEAGQNGDRGLLCNGCKSRLSGDTVTVYRTESVDGRYCRQYSRRAEGGREDCTVADGGVRLLRQYLCSCGRDPEKKYQRIPDRA